MEHPAGDGKPVRDVARGVGDEPSAREVRNVMNVRNVKVKVLEVLAPPPSSPKAGPYNPYTILTVQYLDSSRVEVVYFRWWFALLGRYDVVHIHWPEQLFRGKSRYHTLLRLPFVVLLLARWRLSRMSIVRTVHNQKPHESGSRVFRQFLTAVDSLTTDWVILTEASRRDDMARVTLIPHGHYRDWYESSGRSSVRGALLLFGLIRPYKGVDSLINAFASVNDSVLTLRVVGRPATPQIALELADLAARDDRISTKFAFVPDDELADEIAKSEFVVLPYRDLHNSGAALLALSMDRPIIVPTTEATSMMAEEFGDAWVVRYAAPLSPDSLLAAIQQGRSFDRETRPEMAQREWAALGEQLTTVIVDAAACE